MTVHDWYTENRVAFVARSLEPLEERTFQDHVGRCEYCTRETARLERDLGWLPMGVRPVAPSPDFVRRMATGVLDRRPRWRRRMPLAAVAGLAMVATGVALQARQDERDLRLLLAGRERRLSALEDTMSVIRRANVVLQSRISMNGREHGGMLIFQDARSHRWCVIVHGLPPAPSGSLYQLWFITDGGMVRSVVVHAEGHPALVTLPMPPSAVLGAALTMERAVEWSAEPRGAMLAHAVF